jgi:hypothetical protein
MIETELINMSRKMIRSRINSFADNVILEEFRVDPFFGMCHPVEYYTCGIRNSQADPRNELLSAWKRRKGQKYRGTFAGFVYGSL